MPRKSQSPWQTTAKACEVLNLTPRQLWRLKPDWKIGTHYRIVSRKNAVRPTYPGISPILKNG